MSIPGSNANAGGFQHQPLPTDDLQVLRLLRILPGTKSDPMVCTVDLATCLPPAEKSKEGSPAESMQVNGDNERTRQLSNTAMRCLGGDFDDNLVVVGEFSSGQKSSAERTKEAHPDNTADEAETMISSPQTAELQEGMPSRYDASEMQDPKSEGRGIHPSLSEDTAIRRLREDFDENLVFEGESDLKQTKVGENSMEAHQDKVADKLDSSAYPTTSGDLQESPSKPSLVEYEALSYCWGDAAELRTITLNGHEHRIRQNLDAALRHIRSVTDERVLWVDAICIDQDNTAEKSREVRRMSSIYKHAKRVIIWLGEASEDSDKAMEFAEKIYKCFPVFGFIEDPEFEDDFNWADDDMRINLVKEYLTEEHIESWKALHKLFSRPWWERAWTFQELIASYRATVQSGDTIMPWVVIGTAAQIASLTSGILHMLIFNAPGPYYAWPQRFSELISKAAQARIDQFQKDDRHAQGFLSKSTVVERGEGASKMLTTNMTRSCSLPHDKIFSVLGVLPKALQEAIEPNYEEPARLTFKKAVKACVETTGWLNIICHSQYSQWYPSGHPSWLPDWTKVSRSTIFAERNTRVLPWHFPVGSTEAKASFSDDLSTLMAEGFVIDTVKDWAVELDLLPGARRFYAYHYLSPDQIAELRKIMDTGDPEFQYLDSEQLFWRSDPNAVDFEEQFRRVITPVFLRFTRTALEDPLDLFLDALTELHKKSQSSKDLPTPEPIDEGREVELQDLYTKTRGHLMSRTIFSTNDGLLGIGPDFMRAGDLLCLLLGCDAPVILRLRDDGSYMFVGEAHVSALNEGQGIQGLKDGKFSLTTFKMT